MDENAISKIVVDVAIEVHRELGPGLLESVYEIVLAHELRQCGLQIKRQDPVSVKYKELLFEEGFRCDIVVNDCVILEIKAVEGLNHSHRKQLLTYLRLTNCKLGLLLNFNEGLMKDGIKRIVNGLDD